MLEETRDCKISSVSPDQTSVRKDFKRLSISKTCKLSCCNSCTYCKKAATKERRKSGCCKMPVIKIREFCQTCDKCHNCCTCRGKTKPVLGNLGSLGGQTKGLANAERGLHPPLSDQNELDKVTDCHKLLYQSPQEPLPDRGIVSAYEQKCSRVCQKSRIFGILQPTIFGPKTKQPVEAYPRSQQLEQIPRTKIQIGDTGNNKDVPSDRGVG